MINTSESRIIFNGNGTATEFPYSFAIINDTDVKVMTVDPDGVETVLDSDYYVDVTASKVIYPGYPPGEEPAESERPPVLPTGWQLVVYRDIPITQEANLGNVWPFNVIEDALDKITMILQTSRDTSYRSLKVSESAPSDVDVVVPIAANMALKWDAQGKKIVLTTDPADVLPQAQNLLQQTTQQANIATEQAGIATNKANAAAESAVSAATSETNAGAHEDKAKAWAESETSPDGEPDSKSAKTWASESADSAELAQKWAESEESPDGEPDSKSAKTWAEEAAQSASNAATSETNAANSATEAAGSASAADSSASTATTQAGIATTKAAEAASSATSALDSKNAASTSAGNAATSEENAASSATAASNSASAAAASAQEAAEIAVGIGNPVNDVTENNGTVTVVKSDGTQNTFGVVKSVNGVTPTGGNVDITGVPTGTILPFAGDTIPEGFLACEGAGLSASTYSALYAVIGNTYGGDSTTFKLPNVTNGKLFTSAALSIAENGDFTFNGTGVGTSDGTYHNSTYGASYKLTNAAIGTTNIGSSKNAYASFGVGVLPNTKQPTRGGSWSQAPLPFKYKSGLKIKMPSYVSVKFIIKY